MEYIPQKIDKSHISFAVALRSCHLCKKDMVSNPRYENHWNNVFPVWVGNDFRAQAKRAGLVFQSNIKVDDQYVCEKCKRLADFLCCLCGERKSFPEYRSFGEPPEFLCMDCYAKTPAKEFDEKVEELEEKHRYDFE